MPTWLENSIALISLLASMASLCLALVAIWLSFQFFKQANLDANRASEASGEIKGAVTRLEKLFDRMYSDTFGMVRNMQDKIFTLVPGADGTSTVVSAEVQTTVTEQQGPGTIETSGEKTVELSLKDLAFGVDPDSKDSKSLRRKIRLVLFEVDRPMSLKELVGVLGVTGESAIVPEIFQLNQEGDVWWEGAPASLSSSAPISLTNSARDKMFELRKAALAERANPET